MDVMDDLVLFGKFLRECGGYTKVCIMDIYIGVEMGVFSDEYEQSWSSTHSYICLILASVRVKCLLQVWIRNDSTYKGHIAVIK